MNLLTKKNIVIKIIFLILAVISIQGCDKNKKHEANKFNLRLDTNNVFFDQHKLTIKSIDLINNNGRPISLIDTPETIDFNQQNMPLNWIEKEIPTGQYSRILITLNATSVIQPEINDKGGIEEKHYSLKPTPTNLNTENITIKLHHEFTITHTSKNNFLLFYDAAQSLAIPNEGIDKNVLLFSPMFNLINLSEQGKELETSIENEVEGNAEEYSNDNIGKIHSITHNTTSIKVDDKIKTVHSEDIKITASKNETFVATNSNLHVGQYVIHRENTNELLISPSVLIAEIPHLPSKVSHFKFDAFSINGLSFKDLFYTPSIDVDFSYLPDISLSGLHEALIAFEGYIDTAEDLRFIPLSYQLVPLDFVNVSIAFPSTTKTLNVQNESESSFFLSLSGDSLSSTTAFMTIRDIEIPIERTIKSIQFLNNGIYSMKHQNNTDIDLARVPSKNLRKILQEKFASGLFLSALQITGKFDHKTQTLIAQSATFILSKTLIEQTDDKIITISTTSDEIKTSITVAASALAAGIFSIAVVVAVFTYRTGRVRDDLFNKVVQIIDDTNVSEMLRDISETSKTATQTIDEIKKTLIPSATEFFKSSKQLVDEVDGKGVLKLGRYRKAQ